MLDDLVGVIDTLKSRIEQHRTDLQKNEIRTRVSLIDPLLAALGWDVADPGLVTPEYELTGGKPDYALLSSEEKPAAFVEAKKLGEPLKSHRDQIVTYANKIGVPYAGLTDGDNWEVYTVFDPKPIEDRLILNVAISKTPSPQIALQFLLLWRLNLATMQPMSAAQPIFCPQTSGAKAEAKPAEQPEEAASLPTSKWVGLKAYTVKKDTKPAHVHFPDGAQFPVKSWRNLFVRVAEWLIDNGELTQAKCPVLRTQNPSGRCIVNTLPEHASGTKFGSPALLSNGLYLNVDFTAQKMVGECARLLESLGRDPSTVSIAII